MRGSRWSVESTEEKFKQSDNGSDWLAALISQTNSMSRLLFIPHSGASSVFWGTSSILEDARNRHVDWAWMEGGNIYVAYSFIQVT